jgi:rod shape-determining protein MreD
VKLAVVLLTVAVAVVLQVTLARYTVGGRWVFDLVLVGVVFASLQWGAVAGILAGTTGGLLQDMLAGGVVGVGGLSKTIVGFATGVVGTQFVLVKPQARVIIVVVATVLHRLMILATYGLIDQKWPGVSWTGMLWETGLNSLAAFVVFQANNALPGVISRQRGSRRSSLSRRQW